jgi:hypothetical protein
MGSTGDSVAMRIWFMVRKSKEKIPRNGLRVLQADFLGDFATGMAGTPVLHNPRALRSAFERASIRWKHGLTTARRHLLFRCLALRTGNQLTVQKGCEVPFGTDRRARSMPLYSA